MAFNYLGGYSPHYSLDRIDTINGSNILFNSKDGFGRMVINDDENYRTISSSIVMAAIASDDTLSIKQYLVSEMIDYFLGYNPVTQLEENIASFISGGNYPNPFSADTKIDYTIQEAGRVIIDIYNVNGQVVKQLVNKELLPGDYTVSWDATNNNGGRVESGFYFYKINFGNFTTTEKMLLIR